MKCHCIFTIGTTIEARFGHVNCYAQRVADVDQYSLRCNCIRRQNNRRKVRLNWWWINEWTGAGLFVNWFLLQAGAKSSITCRWQGMTVIRCMLAATATRYRRCLISEPDFSVHLLSRPLSVVVFWRHFCHTACHDHKSILEMQLRLHCSN